MTAAVLAQDLVSLLPHFSLWLPATSGTAYTVPRVGRNLLHESMKHGGKEKMADSVDWSHNYVQANGLNIHYHRSGGADKPKFMLLHGRTDNAMCWYRVASRLQDNYDLIMPDARGHGLTGGSVERISTNTLAGDVAALIAALDLDRPYLFGHSMGALTAMLVAANYPDLVRAIVLEDPPLGDMPRDEQRVEELVQAAIGRRSLSREQLIARMSADNPGWVDEEVRPWADAQLQVNPNALRMEEAGPWREIVRRINCPFLLITGDRELNAIVSPEDAQEAVRLSKHGEIAHIAGAGHSVHRERYEETMAAVEDFLSRV
jgi:N-formylmaleamate deformylase